MVVLIVAFLLVMYLLFAFYFEDFSWAALRRLLEKGMGGFREPMRVLLEFAATLALGVPLFWYMRRSLKRERLFLDETGIRYKSPMPDALRFLQPDWSLQWSQVRGARIRVSKYMADANLAVLEFDVGAAKRHLQALQWAAADSTQETASRGEKLPWREWFLRGIGSSRDTQRMLREVEESVVVRYAKQAGVTFTPAAPSWKESGFALETHRHALAAAVLALLLLGYAIVDIAISEESYAVDPPWVLFALGGAIAVLVSMLWLASAEVPRTETLGLSLLLGSMVGAALYPGLLRVNEATDSEGLREYEYRLTAYVVFTPVDSRLPALELEKDGQYWRQFALGTTHRFELRKGGLGFYQVNLAPVYVKLREYYGGKR